MGFEPTNGGFADLSLGPLGYRAGFLSIPNLNSLPAIRHGRESRLMYALPPEFACNAKVFLRASAKSRSAGAKAIKEGASLRLPVIFFEALREQARSSSEIEKTKSN